MPVQPNSNMLHFLTSSQTTNNTHDTNKSFVINDKGNEMEGVDFSELFKKSSSKGQLSLFNLTNTTDFKSKIFDDKTEKNKFQLNNGNDLPLGEMTIDLKNDELKIFTELTELPDNSEDDLLAFDLAPIDEYLLDDNLKPNTEIKLDAILIDKELNTQLNEDNIKSQKNPLNSKNTFEMLDKTSQFDQLNIEGNKSIKINTDLLTNNAENLNLTIKNYISSQADIKTKLLDNNQNLLNLNINNTLQKNSMENMSINSINTALAESEELSVNSTKEFIQMFKKMNEVDVSYNKNDVTSTLQKEKAVNETITSLISPSKDIFNSKIESNFNIPTQLQSVAQQSQSSLESIINSAAQINSSIDPANETKLHKLPANPEFNQSLKLQENFTPNLAMRIQWMYKQAVSTAEIKMDPPELGPLTVKIHQHNGETSVVFNVSHNATKDMVEDNMAKLREMLQQQGINLGEATVEQQKKGSQQQSNKNELANHSNNNSDETNLQQENQNYRISDKLLDVYS